MKTKRWILTIAVVAVGMICMISKEANIKYIIGGMIYGTSGNNSDIIFSKESGFYEE